MAGDKPPHYTFVFPFVLTKALVELPDLTGFTTAVLRPFALVVRHRVQAT
jgi:hypothetical protein